jgi:hypothetical protein
MEKDWNARLKRGVRVCLLVACSFLLPFSLLWAFFLMATGFQDSTGVPINTGLADHIRIYAMAFAPLLFTSSLIYLAWRSRPKKKSNSN